MINTKDKHITITEKEIESITCDICKKTYKSDDWEEMQEFHHIKFQGGYGSVFGDESMVECDICQHCLKSKLGEFLRISGDWTTLFTGEE